MEELKRTQYRIFNIDCAACAAKLENGLRKVDSIDDAGFDFASQILGVSASPNVKIIEEVRKIEPGATVASKNNDDCDEVPALTEGKKPWEKPLFALALVLFIWQLIYETYAVQMPWPGLSIVIVIIAYLSAGWNVLSNAVSTILRKDFFDENVLMIIATAGALAIGAYTEAIGVMIFFKISEFLQNRTVDRSRKSIRALLSVRPESATVRTASGYQTVKPQRVEPGQEILVKPGEKVPLDGIVLTGDSQIDTSVLTGESMPVAVTPGERVMAGQINLSRTLSVRVTKRFQESSISKVMSLVEDAVGRKAKTEKFISKFARYYTPAVVAAAAVIAFIPPLVIKDATFDIWIYRALVLLVISCPCALVVSIPLGYFGGIGRASRAGILIKGSNFIDVLASVDTVVFDKTGTLTKGEFKVQKIVPSNGFTESQLLAYAAIAEEQSNHPIASAVRDAYKATGHCIEPTQIVEHMDLPGRGVRTRHGTDTIMVGSDSFLHQESIVHPLCKFEGTVANVVVNGSYAGYLLIGDTIRDDAARVVASLRKNGITRIVMLTGDHAAAADVVARAVGIQEVYADLLPEDKVRHIEKMMAENTGSGKLAFFGDGINDAPAIARADVGIAMGALGSDAAIGTSDVVLMDDKLEKFVRLLDIARHTRAIVWQNIALAFVIKGIFISFGAFGLATMWEAVFADMGTALLAVLNSTRSYTLSKKKTV